MSRKMPTLEDGLNAAENGARLPPIQDGNEAAATRYNGFHESHEVYVLESFVDGDSTHRTRGAPFRSMDNFLASEGKAADSSASNSGSVPIPAPSRIILLELKVSNEYPHKGRNFSYIRNDLRGLETHLEESERRFARWLSGPVPSAAFRNFKKPAPMRFGDCLWASLSWNRVCSHLRGPYEPKQCIPLSVDTYDLSDKGIKYFTSSQTIRIVRRPKIVSVSFSSGCIWQMREPLRKSIRETIVAALKEAIASGANPTMSESTLR